MAYNVRYQYDVKGLDFPKEKQLQILQELTEAVESGKAELTGALFHHRRITVWAEVLHAQG